MPGYIRTTATGGAGGWKTAARLFIRTAAGAGGWKSVTDGFIRVSAGAGGWRRFFQLAVTPSIAQTVTVSRNNASFPSTLTGTNYNWTNATSLTYVFQKSSDNVNFVDIGFPQTIANPATSNTVTYALTLADFPAFTSYFRFSVTATNTTFSTTSTSTSSSVTVNQGPPINTVAPAVTPTTGNVTSTVFSTTNGTWNPDDSDGIYAYQWQFTLPSTGTRQNLPGATSSTYDPPTNFFASYGSPIYCNVTATNSAGSTTASSNSAIVSPTGAGAPTSLTATNAPSGRAYNNGRINLSWTAPTDTGGATITGYRIERSTDGTTFTIIVASTGTTTTTYSSTGLDSNQLYYYRVAAVTSAGAGLTSNVASATATTAPQTPTISSVTRVSDTQVSIAFTGANGGSNLTSLTIASSPSITLTYTGTTSPITVTGTFITNISYTFTMSATNANGTSGTSAASSSIIPKVVPIGTVSLGGLTSGAAELNTTLSFTRTGGFLANLTQQWKRYLDATPTNLGTATTQAVGTNYTHVGQEIGVTLSSVGAPDTPQDSNRATIVPPPPTFTLTGGSGQFTISSVQVMSPTDTAYYYYGTYTGASSGTVPETSVTSNRTISALPSGSYTVTLFSRKIDGAVQTNSVRSTSNTATVSVGVPINTVQPSISPSSGRAGTATFTCTTGTWTNTPTSYAYQWEYFKVSISQYEVISGATASTYSPPSNFTTAFGSTIRCGVIATNITGTSATAYSSNTAIVTASTAPGSPTGLTATNTPSGRAFNNGRIDLSWTAPADNGGSAINGYRIDRSTDGVSYTTIVNDTATTATTYSDTGLSTGQIYYYVVYARNANGAGTGSTAANATVTTAPQTPTITSATRVSDTQVSIAFTGANGGSAITSVTITSSPSITLSYTGTTSPITVTGTFVGNQAYTFTMTATNTNGTSSASAASNSVTPKSASIGTITLTGLTSGAAVLGATLGYSRTGTDPITLTQQWKRDFDISVNLGTATTQLVGTDYSIVGESIYVTVSSTGAPDSPQVSNLATIVPPAPTFTLTGGSGQFTISNVQVQSTVGSFYYYGSYSGAGSGTISQQLTGTSTTVTGLAGGSYTVTLFARKVDPTRVGTIDSVSSTSQTASVTAPPTAPGQVQSLSRSTGNGRSKTFTWSAPASDGGSAITRYEYSVNGGAYTSNALSTSVTVALSSSGASSFSARAVNAVGSGSASTLSFTVPDITSGPSTGSIGTTSATVSWTSSSQSSYSLSVPTAPGTPFTGTTGTSVTLTGLSTSTSYTPTLTITSSTSDTHQVTGASFTTLAAVTPPSNVVVTVTSSVLQPGNLTFYPGVTLFASYTANGTTPFTSVTYAWYRSTTSSQGSSFTLVGSSDSLGTNSTYDNRWVRCTVTVTNSAGSASGTSANYYISSAI